MTRAFFFDRDGTVNRSPGPGYVLRWEDFYFQDGAVELLRWLKSHGWKLVLITSQQGVGKGLMTQATLDDIHARMQDQLSHRGAAFDAIYAAIGLDATEPRRKPSPLMIQEAQAALDIDLAASWSVGDKERDIAMGQAAGVGMNVQLGTDAGADWEVSSLRQLHDHLIRWERLMAA
jgi:D-glycero-D-manno-heptose 1,7-bisphosphate phosphatase